MSTTEQSSTSEKPELRASTPKRIKQKYFFMWIGGITAFLVVVVIVASFNVGTTQFRSEMNEHFGPGRPLVPHGLVPQNSLPPSVPSGAAAAAPNAAVPNAAAPNSAVKLEQVYNQIAVSMNQVAVSLSMATGFPSSSGGALGSGFLVGGSHLLTNLHVVENVPAIEATVYYPSKARYPAQVVQTDPAHDLALLRIQSPSELAGAQLGNSDAVDIGDLVLAVGSPLGVGNTISSGMVSAVHKTITTGGRVYQDLLQTTTPIYLGSSGGPLVNLGGQVIGINTIIYSPGGTFTGISFAVPIKFALPLIQRAVPTVSLSPSQNLKLAAGCAVNPAAPGCFLPTAGCAVNPTAPGCFVPTAAPPIGQQPAQPPVAAPGGPSWTMLHCPRCQMYRYPRCPACGHRMILDPTGTQLTCPLGHGVQMGQHRCPICGGAVVPHVHGQPFAFA